MSEGMPGFSGLETEFAPGSVTGVRWWNLDLPGGGIELHGMRKESFWRRGENIARCPGSYCPRPHPRCTCSAAQLACEVPCDCGRCGCGYWAYWLLDGVPDAASFPQPVLGVIEGYGATVIGEKGFRCSRAKIVGLHLPRVNDAKPLRFGPQDPQDGFPAARLVTDPDGLASLTWLELLIGKAYGVPVYREPEMLLAAHPPTTDYLPGA